MHVYLVLQYFQGNTKITGVYVTRPAAERSIKRLPKSAWNDHAVLKKRVKGVTEHGRVISCGQTTYTFYTAIDSDGCKRSKHIRDGLWSRRRSELVNKVGFSKYKYEEIE